MPENKRRALGRGLEELFNIEDMNYEKLEEKIMETSNEDEVKEISLTELRVNPYQPRKTFDQDSLEELATSIKEYGVIQPIIVKKSIKDYEIVAGERRYRASKLAGLTTIPAIVREFSDDQMMEIAILENLQRENLNVIDEAEAYRKLMTTLNLTQEEVSKKIGKSRSHITNLLGILSLPEKIKNLIIDNKISMGHARVLSKLQDMDKIEYLSEEIVKQGISVRELEALANTNEFKRKNQIIRKELSKEYQDLEKELTEYLGTKVKVTNKKVEINYVNEKDLNRILEIINYSKKD